VRRDEAYDPGSAYIYGRFHIDSEPGLFGIGTSQTMGFAVRCRDGNVYTIKFTNKSGIQVMRLAPSVCQIDEFVYTDTSGAIIARRMATFRLLQNEFLDRGGVYYVGDFFARASSKVEPGFFVTTTHLAFKVTAIENNYEDTTAAMKRYFTKLALARTENRMPPKL
jgi:hypothetical protein